MVYCTLFDRNYIDKGIVMVQSLINVDKESRIYILCMDEDCRVMLESEKIKNIELIPLHNFEDNELINIKNKRSRGEYCWTCTAKLIKYVIEERKETICSYVDSDLFFYSNPSILVQEMLDSGCSVQTTMHRFPPTREGKSLEKKIGKNCVQFVTFTNSIDSIMLLDEWISQCIYDCSVENMGDQKYTDSWESLSFVNISRNGGAGIAPWNVSRYKLIDKQEGLVYDKYDKCTYNMVFSHFQGIVYYDRFHVMIKPYRDNLHLDDELMSMLYGDYLETIEVEKKHLEYKYGFCPLVNLYSDIAQVVSTEKTYFSMPLLIKKAKGYLVRKINENKSLYVVKGEKT